MKYTNLKKASMVLAVILATTSAHAYNKQDAKRACLNKITQHGHSQYHNAKDIHIEDKGHRSYKVKGKVNSRRDKHAHRFTCNIRHREVVNWNVGPAERSHKNSAAAVGAGILALAVVAAAANYDKHHNNRHENHATGGSAFDDMKYLKRQCRQNIRHHLKRDHGRVSKVRFDSAHLNHRKLRGTGYVVFERGGERDLSYTCEFDRRGKIYDGRYNYRHRR